VTKAVQEQFTKAKKVKRYVKVALWGDKKSGKTRFGLSFPKPCVIDTERGTLLYADKYDFAVKDANRWQELLQALDALEKGGHEYETLVIDSLTIFWQDLIDVQIEYVKNRRGNEVLSTGDWGTIKRRWKSFINRLVDLNMHVVLVMREKDEYVNETDAPHRRGEEQEDRRTSPRCREVDRLRLRLHPPPRHRRGQEEQEVQAQGDRGRIAARRDPEVRGVRHHGEARLRRHLQADRGEHAHRRRSQASGHRKGECDRGHGPAPAAAAADAASRRNDSAGQRGVVHRRAPRPRPSRSETS
jgi:hypothetical protein